MRHRSGGVGLRSKRPGITGAMGPSTSWDRWPRPVTRAVVGTQECTQIGQNGPSEPFWGIRVHCWTVGLGCGWPWDRNSVHKWEDRVSRRRIGAFVYTVGPWSSCGQARGRRSVHRSTEMTPRSRFRAFVYTVATRVAIRIATRVAPGGTSAPTAMACRRRPLSVATSPLVGKASSTRVAPPRGWRLHRDVSPHKLPRSRI